MIICHLSDWCGYVPTKKIPHADVYVFTGNMLPVLTTVSRHTAQTRRREAYLQGIWAYNNNWLQFLKNPGASIVCVRGGTDRILAKSLFAGADVHEFTYDTMHAKAPNIPTSGCNFVGMPGSPTSYSLDLEDSMTPTQEREFVSKLPVSLPDVLVTHAPPQGILDSVKTTINHTSSATRYVGIPALRDYTKKNTVMLHCFGSATDFGIQRTGTAAKDLLCSNAYGGYNMIKGSFTEGFLCTTTVRYPEKYQISEVFRAARCQEQS